MKQYRADFLYLFCLLVITFVFFGKFFFPVPQILSTFEIGVNDVWHLNFPLKNLLSESLKQNKIPLWDNLRGNGFPILAEGQTGMFNLYNLVAFRFLDTIIAYNLGLVVVFLTNTIGMYFFCRRLKFSSETAFFGAVIYSFSGFFVVHLTHYALLQTASFMPWLFLLTDLLLEKVTLTRLILVSLVFSQQLLSGFPQMAFISAIGLASFGSFLLLTKRVGYGRLLLFGLAMILGVIISAIQILPTMELTTISDRSSGVTTEQILFYKYPLRFLVSFINPFIFGNPQLSTFPHFNQFNGSLFWENTGYIGLLPLVFVPLAFTKKRFSQLHWFYVALGVGAFLLMMGGDSPLYFVLTLPPFSFFRFPTRFLQLFIFCLVILATYGLQTLLQIYRLRKWVFKTIILGTIIFCLVDIFYHWGNYHTLIPYRSFILPPETLSKLSRIPHGSVYTFLGNARAAEGFQKQDVHKIDRLLAYRNELNPNLNLLYKIPTSNAYASSLTPKRLAVYDLALFKGNRLAAEIESEYKITSPSAHLTPDILNLLSMRNTTHIISPIPLINSDFLLVDTISPSTDEPLYIYQNMGSTPKYYLAHQFQKVTTLENFYQLIESTIFDIQSQVLVENEVPFKTSSHKIEEVKLLSETADDLVLQTSSTQSGILVAAITYYPGWKATIDTNPANIFPVNLVNQGVFVPEGRHEVRLKFQPTSFKVGTVISLIGYSVLITILVIKYAKKNA